VLFVGKPSWPDAGPPVAGDQRRPRGTTDQGNQLLEGLCASLSDRLAGKSEQRAEAAPKIPSDRWVVHDLVDFSESQRRKIHQIIDHPADRTCRAGGEELQDFGQTDEALLRASRALEITD